MDRELTKEERRKESRKKIIKIGSVFIAVIVLVVVVVMLLDTGIKGSDLTIAPAETGTLESSVSASGKIVPLYEQSIVSPVCT